jgi:hypothetical protein
MTETIEQPEQDAAEFDDELSDESLERLGVGCVFVCMGWCGSE